MFDLTVPWWELALRGAAVYATVLILLRVTGKRQVGQFTPFDLALLLLISEAASQALTSNEDSWLGAVIVISAMLICNMALGRITMHSVRIEKVIEGRPRFLVRGGRVDYRAMRDEAISRNELLIALRENGCFKPSEVDYAVLETTGQISVRRREERETPPDAAEFPRRAAKPARQPVRQGEPAA